MNRRDFVRTSALSAGAISASGFVPGRQARGQDGKPAKIRIGQLGIGHSHASARMRSLRSLADDFEVVGVVDGRDLTDEISWGGESTAYDGLPWLTEKELLDTPGLQAVIVETSDSGLVPAALRCLERGMAICMDKPGGETLAPYQRLLEGCKEHNLPFQIAYMFRSNPAIHFVWNAVREGWLGDVFEIHAGMSHDYGNERYTNYLSAFEGGLMYLLGCHHIDWVAYVLGRPEKVTSFLGSTKNVANRSKNNCLAVMEYPNTLVSIHASDAEVQGLGKRRIKVCGTKGTIEFSPIERFDGQPLHLSLLLKEAAGDYQAGTHLVDLGVTRDRYVGQLKEFAGMMRGEIESPFSVEHDLLVQEILLAASGYTEWQ